MTGARPILLTVVLAVAAAGCGTDEERVTGVVVEVQGDLTAVESFGIVGSDGERMTFRPGPGLVTFEHGAPLPHLTEHLRTGEPVRVTYRSDDAGGLLALIVEDAG
jgi:hypothetical protein